jgi:predicted acylesterase/phospholipase RssA
MEPSASFDHPSQECDVIMKGGITSGVVYPRAVTELAQTYRLRNVGGTSAGAIAAALAAAAEHGRAAGGFQKLHAIPDFLAANLTSLFQPAAANRPAFEILLAGLSPGGLLKKTLAILGKLIRFHGLAFLIGAALGFGLFWLVADFPSHGQLISSRAMPLRIVSMLIWGIVAAAVSFVRSALRGIQGNAFGMCSGMPAYKDNKVPALTPWMADRLDDIGGKTGGTPLTFGDLWGPSPSGDPEKDPRLRAVNLEVMTTNLTLGSPTRLPTSSRELFFHPEELRRFFPERVVQWMEAHPFAPRDAQETAFIDRIVAETPYRPMPAPADLPVVLAARMSLSFPVLISAVPLYAIDWSLKKNQQAKAEGRAPELGRCWFSDGGIGSNFPVHFFDGLLPEHPTFGINLRPFHPDYPKDEHDESKNVWFPTRSGQALLPAWNPIESLFGFIGSIIGTMQNWSDTTQMRLPGYRDRVVHVYLSPEEGGLNLTMPKERVEALTQRGVAAGKAVQSLDWDGHRWTRFRTAMAQIQEKLDRVKEIYTAGYRRFLAAHDSTQGRYQRPKGWKDYALKSTDDLMKVVEAWDQDPNGYRLDNEPLPSPGAELRMGPKR